MKVDSQDLHYWDERAKHEFQMAQRAGSLSAARPHYRMAISYLDKAEELKRRLRTYGSH